MSTLISRTLCTLLTLGAMPLLAQVDAVELVKHPQYAEKDRRPVFKKLTAEEVRSGIKVTSSRTSALFGFNMAEVQIHLPRVDNSNWMDAEFSEPKLFDKKKREVKFEKEQGIYTHDTWSTEIRFGGVEKKPLDFAKAVGSVHVKYPLVMTTHSVKKTETAKANEAGVTFDGPFIKVDQSKVPESAFASDLEGVRAFDKTGKRLEKVMGYFSNGWKDGVSYKGYAFHGDVTRVEYDTADEWADLEIEYEMPPARELAAEHQGAPSTASETIVETPGAKYNVKIVPSGTE